MLPFRSLRLARQISCSARALRRGCPPDGDGRGRGREEGGNDGGCECLSQETKCEAKVPKKTKKAGRRCGSPGEHDAPGPFREQGIPDHCSKEKALECARKLQDLQKMWEAVAAASEPAVRLAPAKKAAGCPPRPPARDEGGVPPAVLLLAAAALIAAAVWWVLSNQEEGKEGEELKEKVEGDKKKPMP